MNNKVGFDCHTVTEARRKSSRDRYFRCNYPRCSLLFITMPFAIRTAGWLFLYLERIILLTISCLASSIGRRAAFGPRGELFMKSGSFSRPLLVNRALHTSQPLQVAENQQTALPTSNRTEPITTSAQRGSNQLSLVTPQNKAG
jgi:hypothetical protein